MAEVKERYRGKLATKRCYQCNNELEMNTLMMQQTMGGGGFNSTLDNIQAALGTQELNRSFLGHKHNDESLEMESNQ